MKNPNKSHLTILRRKQVEARTGLARSTIYAKTRYDPANPHAYDPGFPQPISLGARAVGWVESEIDEWIRDRIHAGRRVLPGGHSGNASKHPGAHCHLTKRCHSVN